MGQRTGSPAGSVIRGGTVVDGTGAPGVPADVALVGDRIVGVGPRAKDAVDGLGDILELDASGCIVCPGFIDIHTHYDAQLLWDASLSSSCWQGVTTVITGNCGFAIAPASPQHHDLLLGMLHDLEDMSLETLQAGVSWEFGSFADYLSAIEVRHPTLNVGAYVGHSAVRIAVLGAEAYERAATEVEIAQMRALVHEALLAGAVGFSTSGAPTGRPSPTKHATMGEVAAMLAALSELDVGVGAFVPGPNVTHEALYDLQPRVGRPFTWTAILGSIDGSHERLVALHRDGMARGSDVHPQVTCRPLAAQMTMRSPFALRCDAIRELDRATDDERRVAYRDAGWRARAAEQLAGSLLPVRWTHWSIAESAAHPELEGRTVADVAAQRRVGGLDAMLDLSLEDGLTTRFGVVIMNDDPEQVADLLRLEGAVLGLADSGAHPDQLCDAVMPTDLLGGWVRDRGALSLPQAVHKLTGEPAALYGFGERGAVRPGSIGDVVVFDPDTIGPGPFRRVRDLPAEGERLVADQPTGLRHVLVNGVAIRRDGAVVEADHGPGRVLRPLAGSG
jgi:N-acyl-D-aspartate/D-glutamate deacylase